MPDKRVHRGPHPEDAELFSADAWPELRAATSDLCWLLSRGYASPSALKLVGDRYQLALRQRMAVSRCACSEDARERRLRHRVALSEVAGGKLLIDGYNVLTSLEAALGGGVILGARDSCYRDLASVHGTYRKVQETIPALERLGDVVARAGVQECVWYLDSPVSNSGRLKTILTDVAEKGGWKWTIELVRDPDPILAAASEYIASADSEILDRASRWVNLVRELIQATIPNAHVVDLSLADP